MISRVIVNVARVTPSVVPRRTFAVATTNKIKALKFESSKPNKPLPDNLVSCVSVEKAVNLKSPEEMVAEEPVIEVQGMTAVCTGGGPLGHPIEYIQLNTVKKNDVATCKYCGLRFTHAHSHGHDDHH